MRVTATEVKEIINTSLTGVTLDAFITAANLVVTEKLGNLNLGDALLKEIERWLAAHFIHISNISGSKGKVSFERVGETAKSYEAQRSVSFGLNLLSASIYGQTAMVLDLSGTLTSLGKKRASLNTLDVIDV